MWTASQTGKKKEGNDLENCTACEGIDYHEIIDCIVSALDARDSYTAGHSQRVSDMALIICDLIGLKEHSYRT